MVNIRYVEYDASHTCEFVFNIPEGHDCWLLILTQTPAIFYVDNEYKEYPPNCAVLYKPYQKIYYRACKDSYVNDWIRFEADGPYIFSVFSSFGIPVPVRDPSYCHKLYQLLFTEHIMNSSYKDASIDYLIRILLNKMLESYDFNYRSPLQKKLNDLKMDICLNPDKAWTVEKMAQRLNISVGYFEGVYKKTFGRSCITDVIESRVIKAKNYLMYEQYTMAEIAALCGYRNVEHFYRQFKKITGVTPNYYRNNAKS